MYTSTLNCFFFVVDVEAVTETCFRFQVVFNNFQWVQYDIIIK